MLILWDVFFPFVTIASTKRIGLRNKVLRFFSTKKQVTNAESIQCVTLAGQAIGLSFIIAADIITTLRLGTKYVIKTDV